MNIFNELKKYILPYYPIFEYKGQEIYNAIFENWGATAAPNYYMFSDRLRNISSIVRAKAFKTRYEKHGEHKPDFREIIEDIRRYGKIIEFNGVDGGLDYGSNKPKIKVI